jgi:hypothetical protein
MMKMLGLVMQASQRGPNLELQLQRQRQKSLAQLPSPLVRLLLPLTMTPMKVLPATRLVTTTTTIT